MIEENVCIDIDSAKIKPEMPRKIAGIFIAFCSATAGFWLLWYFHVVSAVILALAGFVTAFAINIQFQKKHVLAMFMFFQFHLVLAVALYVVLQDKYHDYTIWIVSGCVVGWLVLCCILFFPKRYVVGELPNRKWLKEATQNLLVCPVCGMDLSYQTRLYCESCNAEYIFAELIEKNRNKESLDEGGNGDEQH